MANKVASVIALDVSCTDTAAREQARQVGLQLILDKLLYAHSEEVGVVLAGTQGSLNPLHAAVGEDAGPNARYQHVTVAHAIAKVSSEHLAPLLALDPSQPATGRCDVLETLVVCTHLLHARTAKKKYNRRIYLLTDVRHEVAHKAEITTILESLKDEGVCVIVVGLNFTQVEASVQGSWEGLGTKEENERVLHYLCATLHAVDGVSNVTSAADALEGLGELRSRKVLQRALAKLVLTVGGVKLATQLHSKMIAEKVPALQKATADGEEVAQRVDFVRVGEADPSAQPRQNSQKSVAPDSLVKALRYGRSLIPCTDADVEAMKMKGPRGLDGVGFVRQQEVPAYIATGATKLLLPLAGDDVGHRGFACLVEAMLGQEMALVVRYVSRADAKPALGVCFPAYKASTDQYILYYAPLPFTEDVRLFRFSEYADVQCTPAEEQLMDSLVNGMTVDKHTLRPNATYNPEVHQFYATVKEKLLKVVDPAYHAGQPDVPELVPQLQQTSAAFDTDGNELAPLLRAVQPLLESCATAFPYVGVDPESAVGDGQGGAWFNAPAAALHGGAAAALLQEADGLSSRSGGGGGAPTTVAAPALVSDRDGDVNSVTARSEGGASVSTVAATAGLASGRADHVSTIDPVGSFQAIVQASAEDPVVRAVAMDRLVDVVFELLRNSIKGSFYGKCDDCVLALRQHCVREEEPTYYNTFLSKLQATLQEMGMLEAYWRPHIADGGAGVQPITRKECATSSIADDRAAREFLAQDRALPCADLAEDAEDDLMDLIV